MDGVEAIAEDGTQTALILKEGVHFYQLDYAKTGTTSTGIKLRYTGTTLPGVSPVVQTTGTPDNGYAIRSRVKYDDAGDMIESTDPVGRVTSYEYDTLGRNTKVTQPDPDGAGGDDAAWTVTTYNAIGDVVGSKNRLNNETTFAYDNLHRLKSKTEPGSSATNYQYDAAGNLTKLTDPLANATDYVYDGLGRLWKEQITLASVLKERVYEYDANSNLAKKTDRLGRVSTFEFDNLDRRTRERWRDGSNNIIRSFRYEYEDRGFVASINETDANSANLFYQYDYVYDQLGRETAATYDYKGDLSSGVGRVSGGSTHFTTIVDAATKYDVFGHRTEIAFSTTTGMTTTPDFINVHSYDRRDRMTLVTQDAQSGGALVQAKRVELDYLDDGQFAAIRRYKEVIGGSTNLAMTSTYGYDGAGRLANLLYFKNSTVFAHYAWNYDSANRVEKFRVGTTTTDPIGDALSANAQNADYTYDTRDQLTAADRNVTDESYGYDANGNRTNGSYGVGAFNRMTTDGTYNYTYDAEGNLTTREKITKTNATDDRWLLEWDYRNRLTKLTRQKYSGGAFSTYDTNEYDYDAFDRRIHQTTDYASNGVNSNHDIFHFFEGTNNVLVIYDSDGYGATAPARINLTLFGPATDQLLADERPATSHSSSLPTLWYVTDNLGTPRAAVLRSGNGVLFNATYDSFGKVLTGGISWSRFGFTGQERDVQTGLLNYNARWYDPATGKFLSEDPLGLRPDENPFRYVKNSPTNATDPTGLEEEMIAFVTRDDGAIYWKPSWLEKDTQELRAHQRNQIQAHQRAFVYNRGVMNDGDLPLSPNEVADASRQMDDYARSFADQTPAALAAADAAWEKARHDAEERAKKTCPGGIAYIRLDGVNQKFKPWTNTAGQDHRDAAADARFAATGPEIRARTALDDAMDAEIERRLRKELMTAHKWQLYNATMDVLGCIGGAYANVAGASIRPGQSTLAWGSPTRATPVLTLPSWQAKIHGTAQMTGTPGHRFRSYREAITEAKNPNVCSVHLDHGYNRALGLPPKTIGPNCRPDIISLYNNRTVVRIEVQSKSDVPQVLVNRNAALDAQLRAQGFTPAPPRVVQPSTSNPR